MITADAPELLHVAGYTTGVTLYAMLLAMVLRAGSGRDRLTLVAALFGLAWNVGELTAHALDGLALPDAARWVAAASYAALGLLSAVTVHSAGSGATAEGQRTMWRLTTSLAYVCAAIAGLIQLAAAARQTALPSPAGLVFLTAGLVVLAPVLYLETRRHPQRRRALWMGALALFAVSALHLSGGHGVSEGWPTEILGHHASIPLAFAILYQDYRFALADLFLKRAITLLVLVALVFAAWSSIAPALVGDAGVTSGPVGLLLAGWIATALVFPWLRSAIQRFVDRVILNRVDYATFVEDLSAGVERCATPDAVLALLCARLQPALSADRVTWRVDAGTPALTAGEFLVPTVDRPAFVVGVGALTGGRRLLSDDITMLHRIAILAARRVDALRLDAERYERLQRERAISALATEAELRALRAQVNPHFLFNALTTLGYLIQTAPPRALDTLLRLTTLLRGVLRSDGEFTTLGQERELLESYLTIESERFEERLQVHIDVPPELRHVQIPALIVQPLVENAIKHGIAPARDGGLVSVTATRDGQADASFLHIRVRNTGAPLTTSTVAAGCGIGLQNVQDRLRVHYGARASVTLASDGAAATVAELRIPLASRELAVPTLAGRSSR